MSSRLAHRLAVLTFVVLLTLIPTSALAQRFITIDPPGSTYTATQAINDVGQIVGVFTDSEGGNHGFLLSEGAYTQIDFPEALSTTAADINNLGQIVGSYEDGNLNWHAFLLSNGVYTSITDPAFVRTLASGIDDLGLIVGSGKDANGVWHGFQYTNGIFTTIDYPGANFTQILDINFSGGILCGYYSLPSFPPNTVQGFTDANGTFTSVTFPGSATTALNGVATNGEVVGTYTLPNELAQHGFSLISGVYSIVDVPGALSTGLSNVNDGGQVTGAYTDFNNVTHGFLMTNGPFAYAPVRSTNSVSVFDVTTDLLAATVPVDSGPIGIGLSPNGATAYVADYDANLVTAFDTMSGEITASILVGSNPLGVAFTPNGLFAYVANNFSNTVSVINTMSNTVVTSVPVGSVPTFLAITPDGNFVYVTNQFSNTVSVISTASNTVIATVPVGSTPVGIAATPNDMFVLVTNAGSNTVSVISTSTNTVTATVNVGTTPLRIAITPDGSAAYVSNDASNTVSVILLATNTVIATVTTGSIPYGTAVTSDGSSDWVINVGASQISVISTATNKVTANLPLVGGSDIAISAAPPIIIPPVTLPLSPTAPNLFSFGSNSQQVQYPPGTQFNNVNMTTTAVQLTQGDFKQLVAGTQFANASCIVYTGSGGNCTEYQVTCTDNNGNPITCPGEQAPTITIQTGFGVTGSIINPGYLTTPLGVNPPQWSNIFDSFYQTGIDPTVRGKSKGFSAFVAVDLGATNAQGLAAFNGLGALQPKLRDQFHSGQTISLKFQLFSYATRQPVTDAKAGLTVVMIADANGNPTSKVVLSLGNAFVYQQDLGYYLYNLNTKGYPPGTYNLSVYGNAFAAHQHQFTITR